MARRAGPPRPTDFHLWDEVTQSVTPLNPRTRRRRQTEAPLPLPPAENPAPKQLPLFIMPPYQSPQTPGKHGFTAIEPGVKRKLQRGRIDIDYTLDLHGMRQDEAYAALRRTLDSRSARGDRTLLVITGKGLKKVDGDAATIVERGVLRTMLPIWLTSSELAPLVSSWDVSHQTHGGAGAFYVRLKRLERAR